MENREGLIKNQIPNNCFLWKNYLSLSLDSIYGSSRFVPYRCEEWESRTEQEGCKKERREGDWIHKWLWSLCRTTSIELIVAIN